MTHQCFAQSDFSLQETTDTKESEQTVLSRSCWQSYGLVQCMQSYVLMTHHIIVEILWRHMETYRDIKSNRSFLTSGKPGNPKIIGGFVGPRSSFEPPRTVSPCHLARRIAMKSGATLPRSYTVGLQASTGRNFVSKLTQNYSCKFRANKRCIKQE